MAVDVEEGIELFIAAARDHGMNSGELDHEVGDLQELLRTAWRLMSDQQRLALVSDPGVVEQYELDGDMEELEELRELLEAR